MYKTPLVGTSLDYSKKENWMIEGNNHLFKRKVDVFFLYPTSVDASCKDDICEDISLIKKEAKRSYLQSADTMADFTNMYVPYYRQLSFTGISKYPTSDAIGKIVHNSVIRTDIFAALDYFFENLNHNRPYILASHSQGSTGIQYVLEEYFLEHPKYYKRMIACYAIGMYFPHDWFKKYPHIKPAKGETDTGVFITWNTVGKGVSVHPMPVGNGDAYCINPLNWKTDDTYAPISLNKGSCKVDKNTLKVNQVPGLSDGQIDTKMGELITTTYNEFVPNGPIFGDKSCHFEDWNLFTQNIKENAKKRIKAYLNTSNIHRRKTYER